MNQTNQMPSGYRKPQVLRSSARPRGPQQQHQVQKAMQQQQWNQQQQIQPYPAMMLLASALPCVTAGGVQDFSDSDYDPTADYGPAPSDVGDGTPPQMWSSDFQGNRAEFEDFSNAPNNHELLGQSYNSWQMRGTAEVEQRFEDSTPQAPAMYWEGPCPSSSNGNWNQNDIQMRTQPGHGSG